MTQVLPFQGDAWWRRFVALTATLMVVAALQPAISAGVPAGVTWPRLSMPGPAVEPALRATPAEATVAVIVQAGPGLAVEAARAVGEAGGDVGTALPLVDGFEATVPGAALSALEEAPSIRSVTEDGAVQFEQLSYDDTTTASSFAKTSGATGAWRAGNLGSGIGVAVIDTGIASMDDFGGRLVHGPDLSGEGTTIDSYGHGTVMGGIVGGSGSDSRTLVGGAFTGMAPEAHLVSVKVAGRNGSTDVSTVLQAMHWVSSYKDQYGIRVLNLSWGTTSTQSPELDPLNYAVQRLWQQGIVVVVAAGNGGPHAGTITKPGDDPLVLTAGAYDDKGSTDPGDDNMPSWTSRGPTAAGLVKPDLVAPGRTIVAARAFGSQVEAQNPKARVGTSYIKGSGSSQAAAVTSGAAALLIAARPELTPDQVKALLMGTASPIGGKTPNDQGKGRIGLDRALATPAGPAVWQRPVATGLGTLEASRGGEHLQTDCGGDGVIDVIRGEIDARCRPWNGTSWTGTSWTGTSWTGTSWTGTSWTGTSWTGTSWTGTSWTGTSWTGGTWTGTSWTGTSWTGTSWTGTSWTGTSWTGTSWTGASKNGTSWTTAGRGADSGFLTAFWGDRPKAGTLVAGELGEGEAPCATQELGDRVRHCTSKT